MSLPDVLLGAAVVGLGIFVYSTAVRFPALPDGTPGPGLFPQILAVLMFLFGLLQVVQGMRNGESSAIRYEPAALVRAALVLAAVGFYIIVLPHLGFLLTSLILLFGLMLLLGVRPMVAIFAALVVAWISALLFGSVLRVPLPPGPLGW